MVPSSQPLRKCRRCPMPRAWPGQLMPLKQTSPAPARGQQSPCSAEQSRPSTASPRCPGPWSSLMLLFLPPLALPHGARSLTQLLPSQLFSTLQNPDEGRGGQHLVSHTSLPHTDQNQARATPDSWENWEMDSSSGPGPRASSRRRAWAAVAPHCLGDSCSCSYNNCQVVGTR